MLKVRHEMLSSSALKQSHGHHKGTCDEKQRANPLTFTLRQSVYYPIDDERKEEDVCLPLGSFRALPV